MPISVTCPGCSSKLNAPDAAAGKQLKCPKCKAACPVPARPAFEVVDEPEAVEPVVNVAAEVVEDEPPKRKAKAVVVEDDEDKDEDEDERPRKKKAVAEWDDEDDERPRKKRGDERPSGKRAERADKPRARGLLIGGIVAGVLALVGGGFAVYWFGFRGPAGGGGGPASAENWHEKASAQNVFKAKFPTEPRASDWKPITGPKVAVELYESGSENVPVGEPSLKFFAGFVRFPDDASDADVDAAQKWFATMNAAPALFAGNPNRYKETINGREWVKFEMIAQNGRLRSDGRVYWLRTGAMFHVMGFRCENQAVPKGTVDAFCAAYEPLAGDPGDPDPNAIKLDNWQQYSAPSGAFRASFPGATEAGPEFAPPKAKGKAEGEFRQYAASVTGGRRTFLAGRVRFDATPTDAQVQEVVKFAADHLFDRRRSLTADGREPLGGYAWGLGSRVQAKSTDPNAHLSGAVRWLTVGPTVYLAGATQPDRVPSAKVLDKFFDSFAVLDVKPGAHTMPHDWFESRAPNAGFRAAVPRAFARTVDSSAVGGAVGGVPVEFVRRYYGTEHSAFYEVQVVRFRPNTSDADRKKVMDALAHGANGPPADAKATKVTWGGRDATDYGRTRVALGTDVGFVARVGAFKPVNTLAKTFLDSFAFDDGDGTGVPPGWVTFRPTDGRFEALVPGGTVTETNLTVGAREQRAVEWAKLYRVAEGQKQYGMVLVKFKPGATELDRLSALNSNVFAPTASVTRARDAQGVRLLWSGRSAVETGSDPSDVFLRRSTNDPQYGIVAGASSQIGKLDLDRANLFLSSFKFDK